ncbi:MAG: hypothetical protein AVDCRST_MAG61-1884 [uncultured Friedmanniella sp.]|uniref:Uncharacterized protein n=1 Tax=uncultured Friedmanniella sp. TaxID=335381 RepID=A0A6J4KRN9_9ACTN|nr:hypothetical protein [uncultured Friedmanniella sp.]CAA9313346.1 MAG: hypothetical protein AVDCRST_MAG61-1884 [uncultured Friedmanniella sp.]
MAKSAVGWSVLDALLDGHWYDAVAALLDTALTRPGPPLVPGQGPGLARARDLAMAARRVLDLDGEDFAAIAATFDAPWAARLASAGFPAEPRATERGALGSLVPLYQLMLEVLDLRAIRREPLQVVVTAHLIGEYLPQLAWESTLGHAGDPLRMEERVGGSRWGTDDPECPHSSALRSTAKRALNACSGDAEGYTAYLNRFHSRQGEALAICAVNSATVGPAERPDVGDWCPNPCAFVTEGPLGERRDLDARVRLARLYVESPLVSLRHHAPVGHFFGVPSTAEISDAWLRTWDRLSAPWNDGSNPLLTTPVGAGVVANEALPGMAALVSAVAGRPLGPGRLLRDIGDDVARALEATQAEVIG